MINSIDLYLGAFLILCGFALSLLNLRRAIKDINSSFPAVLISENILLMCIGIAFISRSINEMSPINTDMENFEERIGDLSVKEEAMDCNFLSVLKGYGPLVVSLVNSFLSLIIDNYMHFRMLADVKKRDEENTVQELNYEISTGRSQVSKCIMFSKKYFSYLAIAVQWIVPVIIALSMYPMEVKERQFLMDGVRSTGDLCLAMVDATNETCLMTNVDGNYSLELRKFLPLHYLEAHDNLINNDSTTIEMNAVINNIFHIISTFTNETNENATNAVLWRTPRAYQNCVKVCYLDNKSLMLYIFVVAIVSFFVPITLSTVILTKIHVMDIKRPGMKTYVTRELLYNILFWTPVMLDTFISLIMCSYSMNGMRTSIFNVIANVYQAVKNFMNSKYFKDNSVSPI